jgi:general secretion pathway protein D
VVVKDQQTVVIGGLMGDKITKTVSKIPLLGDIPLLGWLFRNTSSSKTKTNLLLFLTPYVINDTSDLSGVFFKKVQERRKFLDENDLKERDTVKDQTYNAKPLPYFIPEEEKKRLEEEKVKENEAREKMRKESDIGGKLGEPTESGGGTPTPKASPSPMPEPAAPSAVDPVVVPLPPETSNETPDAKSENAGETPLPPRLN